MRAIKFFIIAFSICLLPRTRCFADENDGHGLLCSPGGDNSTWSNKFEANLNDVLNSLSANVHLHNGFYKATAGKGSDKVYGLVQCRGDISGNNCANCTKESIRQASIDCQKSKKTAIWLTWCFLRYSDKNFYGKKEENSISTATDSLNFDDPNVAAKGFAFMETLASTTPKQPMMFEVSVLNVGEKGKRYGMAQCIRDVSESDCERCLHTLLISFRSSVKKTGWEVYGLSCSMWYHDFKFYSNFTIPAANRPCQEGAMIGKTIVPLVFLAMYIS